MTTKNHRLLLTTALFAVLISVTILGQQAPTAPQTQGWTAAQDHQDMLRQLGITRLRPAPSGSVPEADPKSANYDESKANPFPILPDVMTLKNGRKVTTPAMWNQRRAEILEDFDREVLGRVPKDAPKVTWTVTRSVDFMVGTYPVVGKQLTGHVDNSAYPAIDVNIQMTLVTPADTKSPVPVMMMFGGGRGLPAPPGEPAPASTNTTAGQ